MGPGPRAVLEAALGGLGPLRRRIRPAASSTDVARGARTAGGKKRLGPAALEQLLGLSQGAVEQQPSFDDIFWATRRQALQPIGAGGPARDGVDISYGARGPGQAPGFGRQPRTPFRARSVNPFAGMK